MAQIPPGESVARPRLDRRMAGGLEAKENSCSTEKTRSGGRQGWGEATPLSIFTAEFTLFQQFFTPKALYSKAQGQLRRFAAERHPG